ncbi:MAG TPA: L-threonylcarbamoyladenylate synthase [Tepidisphaeraceae bacterium]|nr:L-threonylcarbamoyladenylate synthase [Tepidisphaeraceae bacterium]
MSMREVIQASAILRGGGLVAFPTETVYGLGADATNPDAVAKIFAAKGRPGTNPLICHVADEAMARRYAATWPDVATKLAQKFWPGPLTLVLPRTDDIAGEATAGLATVGLRAPDHPLTLQLLRVFDRPLAGPSANRSNHVSPTTADHVREDLNGAVDMILDGGACTVGIESTVLDLTGDRPTILRPGSVAREQIEAEIGPVAVDESHHDPALPATSPGRQPKHYAPRAAAYRFDRQRIAAVLEFIVHQGGDPPAMIFIGNAPAQMHIIPLNGIAEIRSDPADCARTLYAVLRRLDRANVKTILIELPPDEPQWLAVRDRILRATQDLP